MNLTIGTIIKFTEAVFTGIYPKAKYSHDRTITGTIIKDSYGSKTGQHTFTIEVTECDDESYSYLEKIKRKGRNVYKKCQVISYPQNHQELAEDKHKRKKSNVDSRKM